MAYQNTFTSEVSKEKLKIPNCLFDILLATGFLKQYNENVKLHVTLMNTKYRKSSNPSSPEKRKPYWRMRRQPFDARTIMEKYKDYYFGESKFDSLHISYMSSVGEDGFYKSLSSIKL